jgi:hypothetical protein
MPKAEVTETEITRGTRISRAWGFGRSHSIALKIVVMVGYEVAKWDRWRNGKSLLITSISDIFFKKNYHQIITTEDRELLYKYIDSLMIL